MKLESLTAYQRQVLVAIGRHCKPNSPYPERWFTELPFIPELRAATAVLRSHGMLEFRHSHWWRCRPTEKGYRQIKSEQGNAAMKHSPGETFLGSIRHRRIGCFALPRDEVVAGVAPSRSHQIGCAEYCR